MIQRPAQTEYSENFQRYIDLVPEGDFMALYEDNSKALTALFSGVPPERENFRYEEGKWTIKNMLMHIIDTERVFGYRMLVGGRGDAKTILYPMGPDAYAEQADVSGRTIADLLEEFGIVRKSNGWLLQHLTETQLVFAATGSTHPITARALAYIIVGHAMHHMHILQERYM